MVFMKFFNTLPSLANNRNENRYRLNTVEKKTKNLLLARRARTNIIMNVVALLRPFVTWRNLNWFSFLHVEYHFPTRQIIFRNPFRRSDIEVAQDCYNSWFYNHVKSDSDHTTITLTFTAELITFYTIFYIALAALFAICMKGLLMTINYESPKWKLNESLIGINPGLGFRPISQDVDQGSLIWYDASNQTQIVYWTKILDGFMQG